jgi:hypothetical protein
MKNQASVCFASVEIEGLAAGVSFELFQVLFVLDSFGHNVL